MNSFRSFAFLFVLACIGTVSFAQQTSDNKIVITGVRFAYPLVEKWVAKYKESNPTAQIQIEARTTTDPSQYDLLIEAYQPEAAVKESREYIYIARYALLPFANSQSSFAKIYSDKGLTNELIKQVYFNDIYSDKKNEKKIDVPYTVYTRLQKAGAPITFAHYFGFEQSNIKGKSIAGADEHLVKALLKDTTGISYSIPGLLYNLQTRKPIDGIVVLPVDTDDNKRVSSEEKFYSSLETVLEKLEAVDVKNIPTEYLHVSILKNNANPEAIKFFKWVLEHGQESLHELGFLKPDSKRFQQEKDRLQQLGLN